MGTINGAKALLLERQTGSLEPGKKADLVLFDALRADWVPVLNPVANLVLSASGDSADTVIVDGKIVLEKGRMTTVDEEQVLRQAQERAEAITERVGQKTLVTPHWPII